MSEEKHGRFNVMIGLNAGSESMGQSYNVLLGTNTQSDFDHCIVIGENIRSSQDYEIVIGNTRVTLSRKLTEEEFKEICQAIRQLTDKLFDYTTGFKNSLVVPAVSDGDEH